MSPSGDRRGHGAVTAGFTLIELLVVMGLLSGFLMMLVQLVDSGVRMFREGELAQAIADRGSHAQRVLTDELVLLRGPGSLRDRDVVDDRLVVQVLPIGLPVRPDATTARGSVVRAAVHLSPEREQSLIDLRITARLLAEEPTLAGEALDQRVAELRRFEPLSGLGNLILLPWRQEGDDDSLLEVRAGWLLPGQLIPLGGDRFGDPFAVPVPGSADLPGVALYATTLPVLRDLLFFEVLLWGQSTRSWSTGAAPGSGSGPFPVWDSARGGWLVDAQSGGEFALDRGPQSANDPRDDVQPHAVLVRCVVAQPAGSPPEGLLDEDLASDHTRLHLYDGERFPGPESNGMVKIGTEWIAYAERDGDTLLGLRRGQRGTTAQDHGRGVRVQVGRTVEFVIPVPHGRDDWNG